jgi:integrase/recombinase XerD
MGLVEVSEETLWLANFISNDTQKTYKNAVSAFLQFSGVQDLNTLKEVNSAVVLAWRNSLIQNGASNRTVNNRMSALSSLFDHLCEKQLVKANPIKGLKRPKVDQRTVKTPPLSIDQVRKMLDAPDRTKAIELRD